MQNLPQHRSSTEVVARPERLRSPCSDWATPDSIMPTVARNFGLVRPVTMTDEAAGEWIAIAAAELDGYRTDQLLAALDAARKECTHHGQIIPFVFKYLEQFRGFKNGGRNGDIPRKPTQAAIAPPREIAGLIEGATKSLTHHHTQRGEIG